MKKTISVVGLTLALAALGSGCGSLRVIEGNLTPPAWAANPAVATNYNPTSYVYASGISTYCVVLEDGISDARHDAIRKLVERVGVAADDTYRTDRTDKRGNSQTGMPNIPQLIMDSSRIEDIKQSVDDRQTRTPTATHVSQTRIHGVEEAELVYTVWRYRPGLWSRLSGNDNAVRYYDVYVLMRCPVENFQQALDADRKWDANPELTRPSLNVEKK